MKRIVVAAVLLIGTFIFQPQTYACGEGGCKVCEARIMRLEESVASLTREVKRLAALKVHECDACSETFYTREERYSHWSAKHRVYTDPAPHPTMIGNKFLIDR